MRTIETLAILLFVGIISMSWYRDEPLWIINYMMGLIIGFGLFDEAMKKPPKRPKPKY